MLLACMGPHRHAAHDGGRTPGLRPARLLHGPLGVERSKHELRLRAATTQLSWSTNHCIPTYTARAAIRRLLLLLEVRVV